MTPLNRENVYSNDRCIRLPHESALQTENAFPLKRNKIKVGHLIKMAGIFENPSIIYLKMLQKWV